MARTQKQSDACARNWRIRSLRALYALASTLTAERRIRVEFAIDEELKLIGAETITLYRAANDTYVRQGTSFGARSVAEAYLDNPNFGGQTLYVCRSIPRGNVIDLTGDDAYATISEIVGREIDESEGPICDLIPQRPSIADALADAGYDWARVPETYPEGAATWQVISRAAEYAASDAMEPA